MSKVPDLSSTLDLALSNIIPPMIFADKKVSACSVAREKQSGRHHYGRRPRGEI